MDAVVGVAADGRPIAAGEQAAAVAEGDVAALLGGGEPVRDTQVEDLRLGAQDGGDDAVVAGEAAGGAGGDGTVALDVGRADAGG